MYYALWYIVTNNFYDILSQARYLHVTTIKPIIYRLRTTHLANKFENEFSNLPMNQNISSKARFCLFLVQWFYFRSI